MSKKNIIDNELELLMSEKFSTYSKYIIQERALPDLRDGLKPVQRRILFSLYKLKLFNDGPYKKSARVVGDVIGKYHPHGDTSVYEAMVRMAQEWKLNCPLIDMHGNKGSIDGDSPAAMRYTETRLSKLAQHLLNNLEKNIVTFADNFDDSEIEPTVLPALFPNILINGSTGIASGYATNIPPHNINEVIKALIFVLRNDNIHLSDLLKIIKGPDLPTGGYIQSKKSIREAYKQGKGKIIISATYEIDEENDIIRITEIPFETIKVDIVKKIDELIREGKIPMLKEVRDDSDRTGLLITLFAKKEANLKIIIDYLFKNTNLQVSYGLNFVCIKDKKPQLLGIVDILTTFSGFLVDTYKKIFSYDKVEALKKLEIIEGLIKAVSIIDELITIIRSSSNKEDSILKIIEKYKFTRLQAEAIVNLRLYRLSSTNIVQLQEDGEELKTKIAHYSRALDERTYLVENVIVNDLEKFLEVFGKKRKSIILDDEEKIEIDEKDLIQKENVYIVLTRFGKIKKVSIKSKEASKNDQTGLEDNDLPIIIKEVDNMKTLLIFTNLGRFYTIFIYKIEEFRWKDIGVEITKYFSFFINEYVVNAFVLNDLAYYGNLVIATKLGQIKKVSLVEFEFVYSKKGTKYINLAENDEVVSAEVACQLSAQLITGTNKGFFVRYMLNEIPESKLNSSGVKNVALDEDDFVVKTIISNKEDDSILFVLNSGKGKRIKVDTLIKSKRASKGKRIFENKDKDVQLVLTNFFIYRNDITFNYLSNEDSRQTISSNVINNIGFNVPLITIAEAPIKMILKENFVDISDLDCLQK